jgi:GT2 family glycosyltransferase
MLPAPAGASLLSVSIGTVVVNWNNAPDTLACLESLASATPPPPRVVVVDNGSADDSIDQIAVWASVRGVCFELIDAPQSHHAYVSADGTCWLTVVRAGDNLGFAGGNNIGLNLLRKEPGLTHFLLLNNDALVAPDYFLQIATALIARPGAGLCIGTIYEQANRDRVWYAGGRIIPLRALVAHYVSVPPRLDPVETEFVTGCAMVIARSALGRAGILPECYFPGYMEDAEYSWRVRACGFPLVYVPRAVVYHKVGGTFGAPSVSPMVAYHINRHRLFFVRRNIRGFQRLSALLYMALTKPGRALVDTVQGRPRIGWAVLRGTVAGFVTRLAAR